MNGQTLGIALASSIASALAVAVAVPAAAFTEPSKDVEACYGVAVKGQNDCASGKHSCAGKSAANYSAADYKFVPVGTCTSMKPHGHQGSLNPPKA